MIPWAMKMISMDPVGPWGLAAWGAWSPGSGPLAMGGIPLQQKYGPEKWLSG